MLEFIGKAIASVSALKRGDVCVVGFPCYTNSSYLHPKESPTRKIRECFHSPSTNRCNEAGADLRELDSLVDLGDPKVSDFFPDINNCVSSIVNRDAKALIIGGDHSITYPAVSAYTASFPKINIIQFDAHPDLYDCFDNNPFSHASPFARIFASGFKGKLVQIGIRTLNKHQLSQAEKYGVEMIMAENVSEYSIPTLDGPVYLSIDLDALDPAYAPGVSHLEPGGISSRTLLNIVKRIPNPIVGADIVELNPDRDRQDITAMIAVKILKELVTLMT